MGTVRKISAEELKNAHGREGLVIQGCGGDLKEWVDGINDILEEQGILQKGSRLDDVAVFQWDGMPNLVFFFGGQKLDMGKLAIWRLGSHEAFGGTWLSDYVDNRLGGFTHGDTAEKPECSFAGEDGNIFNLIGAASRVLRENGMDSQAEEMKGRITGGECGSYDEALKVIGEYVTITDRESGLEMEGPEMDW